MDGRPLGLSGRSDLATALRFVHDLSLIDDPADFPTRLLAGLERLIPGHISSYNEIDLRRRSMSVVGRPGTVVAPAQVEALGRLIHQHPAAGSVRRQDAGAFRISDFLSQAAFHRLELYQEHYRALEVEYQLVTSIPSPGSLAVAIAIDRDRLDFSERDRTMLELLRPHLAVAHQQATQRGRLGLWLAALERATVAAELGVVLLDHRLRVRLVTEPAERWLKRYLGAWPVEGRPLVEPLRGWLHRIVHSRAEAPGGPPQLSLDLAGEEGRLLLRLVPAGERGGADALLVQEVRPGGRRPTPSAMGLTARELEVLTRVAEGEGDKTIAARLDISERTVHKHLEHVYKKLGVQSRTAAASWLMVTDPA